MRRIILMAACSAFFILAAAFTAFATEESDLKTDIAKEDIEMIPEGKGLLTVYSKPVRQSAVIIFLLRDDEEKIGIELSNEGVTCESLPYGHYRIFKEAAVRYDDDCVSLYDIPLKFSIETDFPKDGEFTLDEERPAAEIGSDISPVRIYFTYSENEATTGILTEEYESAYLLMEDARLEYVMTPKERAEFYETFPELSEEYKESMREEIASVCESEGIEPPDDSKINADGSYGEDPYGLKSRELEAVSSGNESKEEVLTQKAIETEAIEASEMETETETRSLREEEMDVRRLIIVLAICIPVIIAAALFIVLKVRKND